MKTKTNISVPTAQNVPLYLEPASIGDRILANILDSLIIFGLMIGLMIVLMIVLIFFMTFLSRLGLNDEVYVEPFITVAFLGSYLFYHLISEIFLNGQSIGKRQLKIQVKRLDGTSPKISNYILRWITRPVDLVFFGMIAIITITLNNKGQRLGDIAAGTTVIKLRPNLDLNKILAYEYLDDTRYSPVYSQAQMIPQQEIEVIKGLIRQKHSSQNTQDLERLANNYQQELGIHSKEPPYIFLKTLVKDFIYLTT